MAAYFAATFTVAYTLWLFSLTSVTCGKTSGEPAEKCDIKVWYSSKIGEGFFPIELSEEQRTLKNTIETMIQKSSTDSDLSNVDCSLLKIYESVFGATDQSESSDQTEDDESVEAEDMDETEDDSDVDFDETEMTDVDESESEEDETSEDYEEETQNEEGAGEDAEQLISGETVAEKDTGAAVSTPVNSFNTCNRNKYNQTCNFCVLYNAVNVQCSPSEWPDQYSFPGSSEISPLSSAVKEPSSEIKESSGAIKESPAAIEDAPKDTKESQEISKESSEETKDSSDETKDLLEETKQSSDETKEIERLKSENKQVDDKGADIAKNNEHDISSSPSSIPSQEKSIDLPTEQDNAQDTQYKATGIDINQFHQLFEKTTGQYMLKMQSLETQIIRLENELLTEKLNKQNHSSSFTRLENQILKLENELLKMNLSYEELKEENEKIIRKQKSFLELDYVKRPGDRPELPGNSTKTYELISQHQNKISELTGHLRNQSDLIDKIRGQSENLEDQNRMLFQIVMNQTMLISQIMKKVESLTDSNMKHHFQQQLLSDKLGIALSSRHAMENLHALVSDQLPLENEDGKKGDKSENVAVGSKTAHKVLSLSKCKHPKKCNTNCGFKSLVLFRCLWNDTQVIAKTSDKSETLEPPKTQETVKNKERDSKNVESIKDKKKIEKKSGRKVSKDEKVKGTNKKAKEESKTSKKIEKKDDASKKNSSTEAIEGRKKEKSTKKITEDKKKPAEQASKKAETNEQNISPERKTDSKAEKRNKVKTSTKDVKSDKSVEKKKTVSKQDKPAVKSDKANSNVKQGKKTKSDSKLVKVDRIPPLYNATKQSEPRDCYDYFKRRNPKDGQYKIKLHGRKSLLPVFCDMKNGGWTVIQRRQDGTVNFFREWDEYKNGFGGLYAEHWLGNDNIHRLTNQDQYELRVDLMVWNRTKKFAIYEYVRVDDEAEGYKLHVEGYSGDAGDGFSKHNGEKFSTKDKDNDRLVKEFGGSCANRFKGAWWYYKCYASNLNGKFYKGGVIPEKLYDGITWKPWTGPNVSLKRVEIKVRPINRKRRPGQ